MVSIGLVPPWAMPSLAGTPCQPHRLGGHQTRWAARWLVSGQFYRPNLFAALSLPDSTQRLADWGNCWQCSLVGWGC
ncbi:MAG: hypothetical protein H6668_22780 [Ardenticatenaceae bacterium]|nr:hypothetical protein [Ardenticatenaceae bacterium]